MEFGCSSVTSEPQAWTWASITKWSCYFCLSSQLDLRRLLSISYMLTHKMNVQPTSTSAQILWFIFELMYTDSAWNGLLSPANISVLHCKSFRPSVRSCLLQPVNHFGKTSRKQLTILPRFSIFQKFIEIIRNNIFLCFSVKSHGGLPKIKRVSSHRLEFGFSRRIMYGMTIISTSNSNNLNFLSKSPKYAIESSEEHLTLKYHLYKKPNKYHLKVRIFEVSSGEFCPYVEDSVIV